MSRYTTNLSELFLFLVLFCLVSSVHAAEVARNPAASEPAFNSGSVYIDPGLITESDYSTFQGISSDGRGTRLVFDRRSGSWEEIDAFLFKADYEDTPDVEVRVNPEFGSVEDAMVEAEFYARATGRIPAALRENLDTITIHRGNEKLGGGNNDILIHTDAAESRAAAGYLEEVLVHEGTHASLDPYHRDALGWVQAQADDPDYISDYAMENSDTEDLAESFLAYLAITTLADRLALEDFDRIVETIPNRIAYLDSQELDLYPMVRLVEPEPPAPIDEQSFVVSGELHNFNYTFHESLDGGTFELAVTYDANARLTRNAANAKSWDESVLGMDLVFFDADGNEVLAETWTLSDNERVNSGSSIRTEDGETVVQWGFSDYDRYLGASFRFIDPTGQLGNELEYPDIPDPSNYETEFHFWSEAGYAATVDGIITEVNPGSGTPEPDQDPEPEPVDERTFTVSGSLEEFHYQQSRQPYLFNFEVPDGFFTVAVTYDANAGNDDLLWEDGILAMEINFFNGNGDILMSEVLDSRAGASGTVTESGPGSNGMFWTEPVAKSTELSLSQQSNDLLYLQDGWARPSSLDGAFSYGFTSHGASGPSGITARGTIQQVGVLPDFTDDNPPATGEPEIGSGPVVEGKEWRQLTQTTGLTWEQIGGAEGVCPVGGGACSGSLGSVSFDGWHWATTDEVVELFGEFVPSYGAPGWSSVSPEHDAGYEELLSTFTPNKQSALRGWTAAPASFTDMGYRLAQTGTAGIDRLLWAGEQIHYLADDAGVWLYRDAVSQPEPDEDPAPDEPGPGAGSDDEGAADNTDEPSGPGPDQPTEPTEPTEPAEPAEPPANPEPSDPAEPANPDGGSEGAESDGTVEDEETDAANGSNAPAENDGSDGSDAPVGSGGSSGDSTGSETNPDASEDSLDGQIARLRSQVDAMEPSVPGSTSPGLAEVMTLANDNARIMATIAMRSRSESLDNAQNEALQSLAGRSLALIRNSFDQSASPEQAATLLDRSSDMLSSALGTGAVLNQELRTGARELSERALAHSLSDLGRDLGRTVSYRDVQSTRAMLRDDPALLDRVLDSVGVELRPVEPGRQEATEAVLERRGFTPARAGRLADGLARFINPASVSFVAADGTAMTLSRSINNGLGGGASISFDGLKGKLNVDAGNDRYPVHVTRVAIVPSSVPDGMNLAPDGSVIVVADGLASKLVPAPADGLGFAAAVNGANAELEFSDAGLMTIPLGAGNTFSGSFGLVPVSAAAGDNNSASPTLTAPSGDPKATGHVFRVDYGNGNSQTVQPMVAEANFHRSLQRAGLEVSTNRATGLITITGAGQLRPSYFVRPLSADDRAFLNDNADPYGIAFRGLDADGDGLVDYEVVSEAGVQVVYAVE